MARRPLSDREKQLLAMPPVRMPVVFNNGFQFSELECYCKCCGQSLPHQMIRGQITRPIPSVAVLEAVGICEPCRTITSYLFRLHDDQRITGPSSTTGKWTVWLPEKSWFERLRDLLLFR